MYRLLVAFVCKGGLVLCDKFYDDMPADRLVGRSAIFWIDNLSAKYGLQKAYSKVEDSGRIINAFKVRQTTLRLRCWFEHIPSEQNIADLPSRGDYTRMMEVIDEVSKWRKIRKKLEKERN